MYIADKSLTGDGFGFACCCGIEDLSIAADDGELFGGAVGF